MGLDINGVRSLLYARMLGVRFTHTAMIGRQSLQLGRRDLKTSFASFGEAIDDSLADAVLIENSGYAEPLIKRLGANIIHSFDRSDYEGATHLHDMNNPLPVGLQERYTAVFDGGSLEHVFNFPVALRNCMEMVNIGGHYVGITPANNFMGHGFYQFSPELYFSVFTRENGFELIRLIAFEDSPWATWYSVKNPRTLQVRVTLLNSSPVYLLVIAKKLMKTAIFESVPQQSDYLTAWSRKDAVLGGALASAPPSAVQASLFDRFKRQIPAPLMRLMRRVLRRSDTVFDPRFFKPMDPVVDGFPPRKKRCGF